MKQPRQVNCPHCQKTVQWCEESPFRPFCSQRCQLIDFGDWAEEKHRIAGEAASPPEQDDPLQ